MNERQPYEEQMNRRWDELPLPDENMAWADMKRRLEKDNDDRLLIPPVRKGCGLWTLLIALLLIGTLWLIVRPEKWFNNESESGIATTERNKESEKSDTSMVISGEKKGEVETSINKSAVDTSSRTYNDRDSSTNRNFSETISQQKSRNTNSQNERSQVRIKSTTGQPTNSTRDNKNSSLNRSNSQKQDTGRIVKPNDRAAQIVAVNEPAAIKNTNDRDVFNSTEPKKDSVSVADRILQGNNKIDTVETVNNITSDSSVVPVKKDSVAVLDSSMVRPKNDKTKEKRAVFFAAGIGMHQQIPIAGQGSVTYDSFGRKGRLSDYIPSVYFIMEKDRRWFLEGGFRYGAPQHNRTTAFNLVSQIDSTPNTTFITTNTKFLKKTFYHQLPLSFNYYVTRGWSIGTGAVWNKFHSAIVENTTTRRTTQTPDTVIGKLTYKLDKDSAEGYGIKRSWMQMFFQSQFQWRRFTIGTRYSFGIQPYISITLPNSPVQNEKNSSFQIFLKYQLWRSKEK